MILTALKAALAAPEPTEPTAFGAPSIDAPPTPTAPQQPDDPGKRLRALAQRYGPAKPPTAAQRDTGDVRLDVDSGGDPGNALKKLAQQYGSPAAPAAPDPLEPPGPFAAEAEKFFADRTAQTLPSPSTADPVRPKPPVMAPKEGTRVGAEAPNPFARQLTGPAKLASDVFAMGAGMLEHPEAGAMLLAIGTPGVAALLATPAAWTGGKKIGQVISEQLDPGAYKTWLDQGGKEVADKDALVAAGQLAVMGLPVSRAARRLLQGVKAPQAIGSRATGVLEHALPGAAMGAAFTPDDPRTGAVFGGGLGGSMGLALGARVPMKPGAAPPDANLSAHPDRLLPRAKQVDPNLTVRVSPEAPVQPPAAESPFSVEMNTPGEALAQLAAKHAGKPSGTRVPPPESTPTARATPVEGTPSTSSGPMQAIKDILTTARQKTADAIAPELAQERRALDRAANTDALTALGNQRAYEGAVKRAEADPNTSVVRFDLNGFKNVNDVVGHDAGDAALKRVADAIREQAKGMPSFRVGGDEFAVIVPAADAARIRDAIEHAVGINEVPGAGGSAKFSISGGIGETNAAADAAAIARKAEHKAAQGIAGRTIPTPSGAPGGIIPRAQAAPASSVRSEPIDKIDVEPESRGLSERVGAAALRAESGRIFTGPTHAEAWNDMLAAGETPAQSGGDFDGFLTSSGRFVSRDEAEQLALANDQLRPGAREKRIPGVTNSELSTHELRYPLHASELAQPSSTTSVRSEPIENIDVEPERFQYKLNTNEKGVGRELESVKQWNPDLAGVVGVWRDPADGRLKVINGHHRRELAERTGQKTLDVREIQAPDATTARTIGAMINVAEGRGTAVDAAKMFRDSQMSPADLEQRGVSLKGQVAKDGLALAQLHPSIFDDVVAGRMPVQRAAVIGSAGLEPEQQLGLTEMLARSESKGKRMSNDAVAELIRFVQGAGTETATQETLFGEEQMVQSLAPEKAELSAFVKDKLAKDRRLFGFLTKGGRAERVEGAGVGKIETGKASALATEAAQAEEVYNKLSTMSGPVADALTAAARELVKGGDKNAIRTQLYEAVADAVRATVGGAEGQRREGSAPAPRGDATAREPGETGATPAVADAGGPAPFVDPDQSGFALGEPGARLRELAKRYGTPEAEQGQSEQVQRERYPDRFLGDQPGGVREEGPAYRGPHQPTGPEFGAPLHDMTGSGKVFPENLYADDGARRYGSGFPDMDRQVLDIIRSSRGDPDARVTIYRAVPEHVNRPRINAGDFVSLSREYAQRHGESNLRGSFKILSKTVRARDVFNDGDSIQEYGYFPQHAVREGEGVREPTRAYHGSPYKFDKFEVDAIGSGEGAQSYGWGHYFASRKDIAEHYRTRLADNTMPPIEVLREYFKPGRVVPAYAGHDRVLSFDEKDGDWSVTVRRVVKKNGEWVDDPSEPHPRRHYTSPHWKEVRQVLGTDAPRPGATYEVDLPDESTFLDWDKPLAEQSPPVRKILEDHFVFPAHQTGKRFYEELAEDQGTELDPSREIERTLADPEAASKLLRSYGINGIRYLDGGSRAKGDGTHNYVVFDDEAVSIRRVEAPRHRYDPAQLDVFLEQQRHPDSAASNARRDDETKKAFGSAAKKQALVDALKKIEGAGLPTSSTRLGEMRAAEQSRRTWVDLRGVHIGGVQDLHRALQVYRHPQVERMHVIMLDGNGHVVSHTAETSGAISFVDVQNIAKWTDAIVRRARRLGVRDVIISHNHPSGDPEESSDDRMFTAGAGALLQRAGIRLQGHLVIDHEKGTWLTPGPHGNIVPTPIAVPQAPAADWTTAYERGSSQLNSALLAQLVRDSASPDAVTVFYFDSQLRVLAVEPRTAASAASIARWLGPQLRAHGARTAAVAAPPERAQEILALVKDARNKAPSNLSAPALPEHAWAHDVTDIVEVTPNGSAAPNTVSYYHQDLLRPEPRDRSGYRGLKRLSESGPKDADAASYRRKSDPGETRGISEGNRVGERDLFGEESPPPERHKSDLGQGSLFSSKEGTAASRNLRETERAARAELEKLRLQEQKTTSPVERVKLARRIAELERLVNRDKAIGADELRYRATAGEGDDLFGGVKERSSEYAEPRPEAEDDARAAFRAAEQDIDFDGAFAKEAGKHRGTWIDRLNRVADAVSNGLGPIERLGDRVEDVVRPGKNPSALLAYTKSSDNTVRLFLHQGIVDPITREVSGPSFASLFAPFKGDTKRIRNAMVYIKAVRDVGRGPSSVADDPELWRRAQRIAEAGDQDPQLKQFAEAWGQYVDGVGMYAVKSGLWTPELWRRLKDSDALYVRFRRILDENVRLAAGEGSREGGVSAKGAGAPRRMVNVGPGIDRFEGSRRPITNPAEAMAEYTGQIIRRADRYRVGAALFEAADALGSEGQFLLTRLSSKEAKARSILGARARANARDFFLDEDSLEELADTFDLRFDKDNPIIWRNTPARGGADGESGGKEFAQVNSPDLWRAVAALHATDESAFRTVLDFTLRPLRRLFVASTTGLNPRFALGTNVVRDAMDLGAKSRGGIRPRDMLRAYGHAIAGTWGGSQLVRQASRAGLGNTSMYGADVKPRSVARRVAPTSMLDKVRSAVASKNPIAMMLHGLERMGDASDRAPRLAEYLAVVRQHQHKVDSGEWTPADLRLFAAARARPVTIDFANKPGHPVFRLAADYIPFFGPAVQAPITFARATARNPGRVAGVAAGVALLAAIGWALKEKRDKEERMALNDRPSGERAAFLMFPLPQGGVLRLPMSSELGFVASTVMATLDKLEDDDPNAGRLFRSAIVRLLPPGIAELAEGNLVPPIPGAQQAIEIGRNEDSFTGRPIEPRRMQDIPPAERRYETTSPTYDAVAAAARRLGLKDFSPLEAEHFARGITSGATPLITMVTDRLASPIVDRPIPTRGDLPLSQHPLNPVSAFYKPSATRSPVSEQDYYDLRERYHQARTFVGRAKRAGDAEAMSRGLRDYERALDPRAGAVFVTVDEKLESLRERDAEIQAARTSGAFPADRARELRQELTTMRQQITRDAVLVLHSMGFRP